MGVGSFGLLGVRLNLDLVWAVGRAAQMVQLSPHRFDANLDQNHHPVNALPDRE
jgi:hypothetical protein